MLMIDKAYLWRYCEDAISGWAFLYRISILVPEKLTEKAL